jgi:hypothetical protein
MNQAPQSQVHGLGKGARRLSWALQLAAAAILAQTLYFKFSGADESVAIFETLGAEPYGRIGLGVVELAAVVLLVRERTALLGALLTLGLMAGALASHLMVLGIEVGGDGGALFGLALVTMLCAAAIGWLRRNELPPLVQRVRGGARRRPGRAPAADPPARLHRGPRIPD